MQKNKKFSAIFSAYITFYLKLFQKFSAKILYLLLQLNLQIINIYYIYYLLIEKTNFLKSFMFVVELYHRYLGDMI